MSRLGTLGVALALSLLLSCNAKHGPPTRPSAPPNGSAKSALAQLSATPGTPTSPSGPPKPGTGDYDRRSREWQCRERIETARRSPGSAPEDFAPPVRAALLAQVKAVPVVFAERPEFATNDPGARYWRHQLEQSELPGRVLAKLFGAFRRSPAFLREVLLTDGYLYAETVPLGVTLSEAVTPNVLFREPELVIHRGGASLRVRRGEDGGYVYEDPPDVGKPARLLLFDRIFVAGHEPSPPRHLDLALLRARWHFDSIELERITADGIVATLHYDAGNELVLLKANRGELQLECTAGRSPYVGRDLHRDRVWCGLERLREAIGWAVDEGLPFDEPKTEFGQEDGKLRQEWRQAYLRGANHYDFNGDTYAVFDPLGRPLVPEVCIDFIMDTLERASGGWYAARLQTPARHGGSLDFDATNMENRRNVEEFIALAERRPDWFDLRLTPPEQRVPLERRDRFFSTLYEQRGEYRPGDIVVILGERSDEKLHYHSFFVFDADPVTGMPSLVAGNSGRPRVRAWAAEMASAPKRSIFARIRPSEHLWTQMFPRCSFVVR